MEEICASIRRILKEDETATLPPTPAPVPAAGPIAGPVPGPAIHDATNPAHDQQGAGNLAGPDDDVLFLDSAMIVSQAQAVQPEPAPAPSMEMPPLELASDPAGAASLDTPPEMSAWSAAPEPIAETLIGPTDTDFAFRELAETIAVAAETAALHDHGMTDQVVPPSSLLDEDTRKAAATSFGALIRSVSERSIAVRSGGPTIEDMVREELRPLLKAWLDSHLPNLVERVVRAEVQRLTDRDIP